MSSNANRHCNVVMGRSRRLLFLGTWTGGISMMDEAGICRRGNIFLGIFHERPSFKRVDFA